MNDLFFLLTLLVMVGIFLFTLDDLFIDCVAIIGKLRPRKLTEADLRNMRITPQKNIAILIANWKEEDVLEYMIRGNIENINYQNYSFFLGVYPNDAATWEIARKLETTFPNVFVVVNSLPGPTSKGQLLNEMVRKILESEKATGIRHDVFLLQDSEDLIHPFSLQLINTEISGADFVQIPVFSLKVKATQLVAGVYMDEFAESHTKDMLVRNRLNAPIPSAGVGTALSRKLIESLLEAQNGNFLNEDCLTEDYQLGILTSKLGYKTTFACCYRETEDGEKDFIATREYFPDKASTSIKQKTRWTIGIAFQSLQRFGWNGTLLEKYFLWRDRRGPWNGLILACTAIVGMGTTSYVLTHNGEFPAYTGSEWFQELMFINLCQMIWRISQRMRYTAKIYGIGFALLVPIRWPIGNFVNTISAWKAFRIYQQSVRTGSRPAWVKTQHKLPEQFGRQPLERKEPSKEIRA